MIPATRVVDPFEDAIQLSRNLPFWYPELLKVARVAGGRFEPHKIAGINREHRLEGGIEKATMDGVRTGLWGGRWDAVELTCARGSSVDYRRPRLSS